MSRRLTALLAAPALAAALASGCADEAAAARVGDTTISNDDLMSQVEAIAGNEDLLGGLFGLTEDQAIGQADADRSYRQEYVGFVLGLRIRNHLDQQVLEDEGRPLTDDDIEAAEGLLPTFFPSLDPDSAPQSLQDELVLLIATRVAQIEEFGGPGISIETVTEEQFLDIQRQSNAAAVEVASETDVEISSRYGSWDAAQLKVTPPVGPVVPGSDDLEFEQP